MRILFPSRRIKDRLSVPRWVVRAGPTGSPGACLSTCLAPWTCERGGRESFSDHAAPRGTTVAEKDSRPRGLPVWRCEYCFPRAESRTDCPCRGGWFGLDQREAPVRVSRPASHHGRASEGVGSLFQIMPHPEERLWLKETPEPVGCQSGDANTVSLTPNQGQTVRAAVGGSGWTNGKPRCVSLDLPRTMDVRARGSGVFFRSCRTQRNDCG